MKNQIIYLFCFSLILFSFKDSKNAYVPGDTVENFKLLNTNGKMVSLDDFKKSKGVVIIFTCNHCPYSVAYEDRIIALDKKYKKKGFPVIAINSNDSASYPDDSYPNMKNRAKEKKFTFPYLHDATQEIAKKFGAIKTPHVYVLKNYSKEKVWKSEYVGAIDDNYENAELVKSKYLENAIEELLANKEVTVKTTKAIGCGIKWKKS